MLPETKGDAVKRKPNSDAQTRTAKPNGKVQRHVRVTKFAPDRPEARDEGPRLLPLDGARRLEHYGRAMELGDIALGNRQGQNNKNTAARTQVTRHGQPAKSSTKGRATDA